MGGCPAEWKCARKAVRRRFAAARMASRYTHERAVALSRARFQFQQQKACAKEGGAICPVHGFMVKQGVQTGVKGGLNED